MWFASRMLQVDGDFGPHVSPEIAIEEFVFRDQRMQDFFGE